MCSHLNFILIYDLLTFNRRFRFTRPNLFVQQGAEDSQLCYRNFRDFVFQILPSLRYDAMKEYSTFKKVYEKKLAQGLINASDDMRLQQLTKKFQEEKTQNDLQLTRRTGEKVMYGDEIMIRHYDS